MAFYIAHRPPEAATANQTVSPPVATASASGLIPAGLLQVPPAAASASASAPQPAIQLRLAEPSATASASSLVPVPQLAVAPPVAAASASTPTPLADVTVSVPAATASASSPLPLLVQRANTFEGGSNTTVITTGNSGGTSGDAFDTVIGSPTYSTAQAHSGTLSFAPVASVDNEVRWTDAGALGGNHFTTLYLRAYLYIQANPSGNTVIMGGKNDAGTTIWRVALTTAGKITININGTAVVTSTNALTQNAWTRLEAQIVLSAGVASIQAELFNAAESATPTETINTSAADAVSSYIGSVLYGPTSAAGFTAPPFFDDVAFSSVTWVGPAPITGTTVSPPAATASASAPAPVVAVQVAVPVASAAASAPTPSLQLRVSPPAAAAAASGTHRSLLTVYSMTADALNALDAVDPTFCRAFLNTANTYIRDDTTINAAYTLVKRFRKYGSYAQLYADYNSGALPAGCVPTNFPVFSQAAPSAGSWVMMDMEQWSTPAGTPAVTSTPTSDQFDAITAVDNFIALAHAHSLHVYAADSRDIASPGMIGDPSWTPDQTGVNPLHYQNEPGFSGETLSVAWLRIGFATHEAAGDMVLVQTQAHQADPASFAALLSGAAGQIRAVNPGLFINAALSNGLSQGYLGGVDAYTIISANAANLDGVWLNVATGDPVAVRNTLDFLRIAAPLSLPAPEVTVPIPVATAAASAPAPTVAGGQTVAPPAATASASSPVAAIQLRVSVPLATASASSPVPGVFAGQTVAPPAATASASAPVPAVQVQVPAPVASSSASGPAPTVTAAVFVLPPIATASASSLIPAVKLQIAAALATASASARLPAFGVTIILPAASASASAPLPVLRLNIAAPSATAAAAMLAPLVFGGALIIVTAPFQSSPASGVTDSPTETSFQDGPLVGASSNPTSGRFN